MTIQSPERPEQFGLIGLGIMGQNLSLNIAEQGYRLVVHDRAPDVRERFAGGLPPGLDITTADSLRALVQRLERPRRIIMLVRAGEATDSVIDALVPLLEPGDLVVDCGNSHYPDTERRCLKMAQRQLLFIGSGISGGEEGARHGPSLMPGGHEAGWPLIRDMFKAVSAKVHGEACCDWVGAGGAGHYVKMVHNGIEYGDMQLIAEAYELLRRGLQLNHREMAQVFRSWQSGPLDSYLIDISADILEYEDHDGHALLDSVLDAAGQKGTGKWTGVSSLEFGVPVSLVTEAVYARCLSALTDVRKTASGLLAGPQSELIAPAGSPECDSFIADLEQALYAAKILSYTQGFMLLREASRCHEWGLNLSNVAGLWRGGCIIRSRFLDDIVAACQADTDMECLALAPFFSDALNRAQLPWRRVVGAACGAGLAVPGFSSALAFYDGLRAERGPANLLQAQRDYFGGHTYERIDRPRGEYFHTDWSGQGGSVASGSYSV